MSGAPGRGTVVLLAFACDPEAGSEPGAGWVAVEAATQVASSVIVFTRADSGTTLSERAARLPADVEIVRIRTPFDTRGPVYVRYAAWIALAAAELRRRVKRTDSIDVVHHVTYASDWMPSPLAFVGGLKSRIRRTVWGPVGGATYPDRGLLRIFPARFRLSELVRGAATRTVRAFALPLHRRNVDVAVAMNDDSARAMKRFRRVEMSPNAVIDAALLPDAPEQREDVVVFAGRPLEWKGIRLALKARELAAEPWTLELYGASAEEFAVFGTLSGSVSVQGRVPRTELLKRLASAKALVLPSLHDSAAWIAAEAASLGTPVVCLDIGGVPAMAADSAVVVPSAPAVNLAERIALTLDALVSRPAETTPDHFLWGRDRYVEKLRGWYDLR